MLYSPLNYYFLNKNIFKIKKTQLFKNIALCIFDMVWYDILFYNSRLFISLIFNLNVKEKMKHIYIYMSIFVKFNLVDFVI